MIKLEIKEIENLPNKETTKPKLTFRTFKVKKKKDKYNQNQKVLRSNIR